MADIQFAVNLRSASSQGDLRGLVSRADELGYDVLAAPDHLGALAPFASLAAAGMASDGLRLRTYVLNAGFWNPALLAREVATLDVLSDGRAELGIGAGHMKSEHDDAGLPWSPLAQRVRALEDIATEVCRRLGDPACEPRPVQRPVPLMIAAMSRAGLAVAARHADVVGFAGLRQAKGAAIGTFTLCSPEETAERVDHVRSTAAGRAYRSDALLQAVIVGEDPGEAAARIADRVPEMTAGQVLASPFVLLAEDAGRAAAELRRRRELYGFDCVTTHQPNMEALGQVIAAYRGTTSPRAVAGTGTV